MSNTVHARSRVRATFTGADLDISALVVARIPCASVDEAVAEAERVVKAVGDAVGGANDLPVSLPDTDDRQGLAWALLFHDQLKEAQKRIAKARSLLGEALGLMPPSFGYRKAEAAFEILNSGQRFDEPTRPDPNVL